MAEKNFNFKQKLYIHNYLWKIKDFCCISVEQESG